MEDKTIHVGQVVKVPGGDLCEIVAYDKVKGVVEVKLDSGELECFKVSSLNPLSPDGLEDAEFLEEAEGPGGSEDW